nr:ATP-binding protein [Limosilactobacillus mucosae]
MQSSGQANIVLDPTGEYAQLPNAIVYRLGENAYLEPGEFSAAQLIEALGLHFDERLSTAAASAVNDLRIQNNLRNQSGCYQRISQPIAAHQQELEKLGRWSKSYAVQLLPDQLIEELVIPYDDQRADYQLLGQTYDRQLIAAAWPKIIQLRELLASLAVRKLFGMIHQPQQVKTELNFVLQMFLNQRSAHKTLVIDLSALKTLAIGQRAVISLLMKRILEHRLQHNAAFSVNIIIDKAHRYLPADETKLAENGIFQVLREGRKVGLNMILTTQSPLDLPAKLRSQFPNLLVHHLASPEEISSLNLDTQLVATVSGLGIGQAVACQLNQPPRVIDVPLPGWLNNKGDF